MISGQNVTSPRTQIAVDEHTLIEGDYKLIIGTKVDYATWGGPFYPNATSNGSLALTKLDCTDGCLFDITHDETEHENIFHENMDIAGRMNDTLTRLRKGYYTNDEEGIPFCPSNYTANHKCQCWAAVNKYGGFWGPCHYLPSSDM